MEPIDRLPPNDAEAESAVIGAILMDPEALSRISSDLESGDFYRSRNAEIYAAAVSLSARRQPTDWTVLSAELRALGSYDEIGGMAYLSECCGVVPTAAHAEHYARIVREMGIRRRLITAAGHIAGLAYDTGTELEEVMTRTMDALSLVQSATGGIDLFTPEQRAEMVLDMVDQLGRGLPPGIPTGYGRLDWLTGGLRRGCLYVIGAPTGVGKTSFMASTARHLRRSNKRVLFASSEMNVEELNKRDLAASMGRDYNEIERELVRPADYPETATVVAAAIGRLDREMSHVYHGASMTTDRIRRRAARMKAEGGLDCVFVDYLQRLADSDRKLNREQQVTAIARSLKTMAADLEVPVVVAAQFNRACLYRTEDPEPRLSDFRESGGIEQEGDVVMGLFRESKFRPEANTTEAKLFVLKNRHGQEDKIVRLRWLAQTCSYESPATEEGRAE